MIVAVCMFLYLLILSLKNTVCDKEISPFSRDIESKCSSPNVRTVLFRQSDLDKECWNREEIALLFTRRMMQELLPKRKPTAVSSLLDYCKDCLETVKQLAPSRKTHALVVTAMADTLGGYLQAFGIPMAHQAFYEGSLGYNSAKQLHELIDAFKKLLKTDGGGWTKPIKVKRSCKIIPFRLSHSPTGIDSCSVLVTRNELSKNSKQGGVEILMPFLDDPNNPAAIALPFKDKNLFSLTSKGCPNLIVKYYSRAVWCLLQSYGTSSIPDKGPSRIPQVQGFFNSFNQWLNDYVIPRLDDPCFYPAFGSVLRLIETINSKDKDSKPVKERLYLTPSALAALELDETTGRSDCNEETSRKFYIIVISSLVIAFWVIVCFIYCLYKWFAKRKSDEGCEDSVISGSSTEEPYSETSEGESSSTQSTRKRRRSRKRKKKNKCTIS